MRQFLLFAVLVLASAVLGRHSFKINGENVLALKTFAFRDNGVAHIELNDVTFNPPVENETGKFGFLLFNTYAKDHGLLLEQFLERQYLENPSYCPSTVYDKSSDSEDLKGTTLHKPIFFPWYNPQTPSSAVEIEKGGYYTLVFYRCTPSLVQAKVGYELLNVYNGKQREIDAGEEHVGFLNFSFAFIFFALGVLWFGLMVRNRQGVHAIHWLMLILCVVKSLELLSWSMFYWLSKHNFHHNFMRYTSWFLVSIRSCFLFMLIALLGSGWSLFSPVLSKNRKRVLFVVLILQLIVNFIHPFVVDEVVGAGNAVVWETILDLFDIICCCAVLLPSVWTIQNLEKASEDDEKAVTHLSRLRKFRDFYVVTIIYIYITRLIVPFVMIQVDYKKEWIHPLIEHCISSLYYLYTGFSFRPLKNDQYMRLAMDEDDKVNEWEEVL